MEIPIVKSINKSEVFTGIEDPRYFRAIRKYTFMKAEGHSFNMAKACIKTAKLSGTGARFFVIDFTKDGEKFSCIVETSNAILLPKDVLEVEPVYVKILDSDYNTGYVERRHKIE